MLLAKHCDEAGDNRSSGGFRPMLDAWLAKSVGNRIYSPRCTCRCSSAAVDMLGIVADADVCGTLAWETGKRLGLRNVGRVIIS